MTRAVGYLAGDGQRLSVADADGRVLVEGDALDLLGKLRHEQLDLVSADDAAVVAVLAAVYGHDRPESVAVRGHDGL
ncbi:MAG: hypothetical protein EBU07_20210, partial [Betaproteobacteria bacterium]|nr:hypothetical protein [Betaproteobacteria bacterium]